MTLTSLCSVMVFAISTASDVEFVSSCAYAAWYFAANYLLQFLLFVPLMVFDEQRRKRSANFCCPWLRARGGPRVPDADRRPMRASRAARLSTRSWRRRCWRFCAAE